MARTAALLLVAGSALVVWAAPVPKGVKNKNKELAELLGEWLEPPEKARIWWFKEDGTAGGGDLKDPSRKGLFRIDPTTEPKSLDWSDDGGNTWRLGVYSIDNGVLTVNMADSGLAVRPVSLDDSPKSSRITATRKKDDK